MDLTREERMRSRMRGAARHQVQNADFGDLFTIPVIAPDAENQPEREPGPLAQATAALSSEPAASTPVPSATQHVSPNTSAKRRRLDPRGTSAPVPKSHSPAQLPRQSSSATRRSPPLSRSPTDSVHGGLADAPATADGHEPLPKPTPPSRTSASRLPDSRSAARVRAARHPSPLTIAQHAEEIGESPTDQPGSGQRRRVRHVQTVTSSALLQSALRADDDDDALQDVMPSSSPLTRKSRKSTAATTVSAPSSRASLRRSSRLSSSSDGGVGAPFSDPLAPVENAGPATAPNSQLPSRAEVNPAEVDESVVGQGTASDHLGSEAAQPVDGTEVARHLGEKRQLRSKALASPGLVSEEPSVKRPRKIPRSKPKQRSPGRQKHPRAPRAKSRKQKPATRVMTGQDATVQPISLKIQRFTRPRRLDEDDPEAEDILNTEIPFASRSGVNAVDVLAQMCEELINSGHHKLQDTFDNAQDVATKKELRVKLRALEAFQEETRTRFLEQTIALDTLYALRKRVRQAQKSKLRLRERIIQIRAEREQVALRMDAVRMKHEEDGKEALHNIKLSAAMHDVDLAIEQGRAAPELSDKGQKVADLANLELLVERVREQACGHLPGGGNLRRIRGFNAFLERAVAAL
ncbi:hypothetical protein KVR01_006554 [Diaporthe batatas]|uniref:uncharacterized protein n=1 Tax=Diaporthe batatas TaxID=748121 RepID=UPI001D04A254|nr:uncharacterized protein KVR01_006554 [Diaporthe batatas]KAG8163257.1 hypothetical protein KVR01_006554 [Diaporthe batatas]